jgi:hypothetical protein
LAKVSHNTATASADDAGKEGCSDSCYDIINACHIILLSDLLDRHAIVYRGESRTWCFAAGDGGGVDSARRVAGLVASKSQS